MKKVFWPLIISISLSLGILLGGFVVSLSHKPMRLSQNANKVKLNKLIDFIENEYVDPIDTDSIVDKTVMSILKQLDPHSIYIGKSNMQADYELMKGEFTGIGIRFYIDNDTLAVLKESPNGPAAKAGILPGDRILYADDKKLFGNNIPNDSVLSILRGKEDSNVHLEIYRKKEDSSFSVDVKRTKIPMKSTDIGFKLKNGMGYIKINRFSQSTYSEFFNLLEDLRSKGIKALILDLRDNSGGYMDQAIKIIDEFFPDDYVIVKTKNKKGYELLTKSSPSGIYTSDPIYVLVDENSASASEIIAGAIQDNDRGTIVGRRTFGKGLVQRKMLLGDGSAIRLTTARYYTPSGRSIQKPYNHGLEEYNHDFIDRYESGELYEADSIKIADSLQYKTLKGRIVYGGGGIVPDIFIPKAKDHREDAIGLLMHSPIVQHFIFKEIDKDRKKYEAMSQRELVDYINSNGSFLYDFESHLKNLGLQFELNQYEDIIKHFTIAELLNQLKGEADYYQWILREDPMIIAIEKIQ